MKIKNLLNVPKNDYRGLASEILILWEKGYLKSRESCKVELPIQIISSQWVYMLVYTIQQHENDRNLHFEFSDWFIGAEVPLFVYNIIFTTWQV